MSTPYTLLCLYKYTVADKLKVNLSRLQGNSQDFKYDNQEDLESCVARWFIKLGKELKMDVRDIGSSSRKKIMFKNKQTLSGWLVDAVDFVRRQRTQMTIMMETIECFKTEALADKAKINELQGELLAKKEEQLKLLKTAVEETVKTAMDSGIQSTMMETIERFKTEALADKSKINELQGELLVKKDEQLMLLKTAVEETVKAAVDSGIQSYSAAVQKNKTSATICSSEKLKKGKKSVAAEEDRSRNLIAKEQKEEELQVLVSAYLGEIEEKPHFEATRVGWKRPGAAVRPVKIIVPSSETIECFKVEPLADKAKVIGLQEELLVKKDEQFKLLKTSVEETVKEAVDSRIQSYSAAVQKNSGTVSSGKKLKKGKKSVTTEEDRSRNLIEKEEKEELPLPDFVTAVSEEIRETPHFEATRFICISDLLYICIFALS